MGKAKRGATNLIGILAVDKPCSVTSHDVVDEIRRITGEGRVGHTGTLDPMATGLLLICIGPATRLSNLITAHDKTYQARIVFGSATSTDDAEGEIIATVPVPEGLGDAHYVLRVLEAFTGTFEQMPPQFAAIKKDGRKAYQSARQGKAVELEPRVVTIHSIKLIEATDHYWDIGAQVSKGTYIRSLARDLGEAVGSRAHLASLRRTRCGKVSIEQACTLEELRAAACDVHDFFLDPQVDLGIPEESIPMSLREALRRDKGDGPLCPPSIPLSYTEPAFSCHSEHQRRILPALAPVHRLDSNLVLGEFVCAIGVFDGVHQGHRFLIDKTIEQARHLQLPAIAITFDRDPDELFVRPGALRKLLSNEDRISLLAQSGVDAVCVIPFERELSRLDPQSFLDVVIAKHGSPRGIHIGSDFRFGHKAAGTTEDLTLWASAHNCEVFPHNLYTDAGSSVTSTRIRNALQAGDLALANKLLMRPHYIWATVVKGRSAGRNLGFPTANLRPDDYLIPPADGVYVSAVIIEGRLYRAATSVGVPSTFTHTSPTIEAHILDFDDDLYGLRLQIFFFELLRPMISFSTVDELQKTVFHNIEQTRTYKLPTSIESCTEPTLSSSQAAG